MRRRVASVVLILTLIFNTGIIFSSAAPATSATSVNVVNPVFNKVYTADNILISIKLTQPTTIKVACSKIQQENNGVFYYMNVDTFQKNPASVYELKTREVPVIKQDSYTSQNNLTYYTKKIPNVTAGVYKITVTTVSGGKVLKMDEGYIGIKDKRSGKEIFHENKTPVIKVFKSKLMSGNQ